MTIAIIDVLFPPISLWYFQAIKLKINATIASILTPRRNVTDWIIAGILLNETFGPRCGVGPAYKPPNINKICKVKSATAMQNDALPFVLRTGFSFAFMALPLTAKIQNLR